MALQDYTGRTIQAADLNSNFNDERATIDAFRGQSGTRPGLNFGFAVVGLDDGTAVSLQKRVFDFRPSDDFEVDAVRIYAPTSAVPTATLTLTCPAGAQYLLNKTWTWTLPTATVNFAENLASVVGFSQLWLKKGVPYRLTLVGSTSTAFLIVHAALAGRVRRRRS